MNFIKYKFIAYSFFFLSFVLSIQHVLSIRNLIFYLSLLIIGYLFLKKDVYKSTVLENNKFLKIKKSYLLLTIWLFIGLIFFSYNQKFVLSEIKSQWIIPFLYFCTAFCSFLVFDTKREYFNKYIFTAILLGFFIHVLYIDLYALQYFIENKLIITRFGGLEGTPDRANYVTNLVLGLVSAEVVYRVKTKEKYILVDNFLLAIILFLTLASVIFESMRNGSIAVFFLIFSSLFLIFYKSNYSVIIKYSVTIIIALSMFFPIYYNLKNDYRWKTLIETIPISLDTVNNKYWLNSATYPVPKLSDGSDIDDSNYTRLAWFKEGLLFAIEKPFGIGFQRNSFGEAMQMKYNYHARSTSHSGLIDWLIGMGFIGIILFFYIIFLILKYSFKLYFIKYNYFSIALIFFVTGTISRFIVDPNLRDHMLLTFMFVLGFLLAGLLNTDEKTKLN